MIAVLLLPVGALATTCPAVGASATCCCCCVCGCDACDEAAAAPEDEAPATETANPIDYSSMNLRFNELFPNPNGTDSESEFIELANDGVTTAALAGWEIRDDKGRVFRFADGSISVGSEIALPYSETKIPLPNAGGSLTLHDPNGTERDAATYGSPVPEGSTFARFGTAWAWTISPTPGAENALTAVEEAEAVADGAETAPDAGAAPAEEEAPQEDAVPATTTAAILLSELMPNPAGDDAAAEWIELYNPGPETGLAGWSIDDGEAGSSPYLFPAGTMVASGGYLTVMRTDSGLALNNDTDSVRLFSPDGALADAVAYSDANEGEAFARGSDGWYWTAEQTPGAANAIMTAASEMGETTPASVDEAEISAADADGAPYMIPVEAAHDLPDGTEITVVGVVTVPPGALSKTVFGIQDAETDFGMTVRIYGDVPSLSRGDFISVTGTIMRKSNGELRINTSAPGISILGRDGVAEWTKTLGEIDGSSAGTAVNVQGAVSDMGSDWIIITDDDASHEIKIELPDGLSQTFRTGDQVSVRGVVRTENSTLALAVADPADIVAIEESDAAADIGGTTADSRSLVQGNQTENGKVLLPFLVVGAIGAGGVAYRGLRGRNDAKNGVRRRG